MEEIPPHIKARGFCPVCEAPFPLTHRKGDDFDLRPVTQHIVQAHPELRDNRHVPNVRVQWEIQPPQRP